MRSCRREALLVLSLCLSLSLNSGYEWSLVPSPTDDKWEVVEEKLTRSEVMFYFHSARKFRGTQSKVLVSQSLELMFLLFLQFSASASTDYIYEPVRITITNSGGETIWPQIATNPSSPQQPVSTLGFALEPGKSKNVTALPNMEAKIWAKTQCAPDATGVLSCATGDCGSFLAGDCPPPTITVAEFRLNNTGYGQFCSFSVNLEIGFNLPLTVVARGGTRTKCAYYTVEFGPLSLPRTPAPFGETNGDYDSQDGYDFSEKPKHKKKSKPNIKIIIGIIITVMSLLGLITWKFQIFCCSSVNNLSAPKQ